MQYDVCNKRDNCLGPWVRLPRMSSSHSGVSELYDISRSSRNSTHTGTSDFIDDGYISTLEEQGENCLNEQTEVMVWPPVHHQTNVTTIAATPPFAWTPKQG